ncbi:MAG: hypothetical protein J6T12_01645 [Salinivirgaceae bacterium]|nr:hypothetical protein [Salinivirgaceae bacterium]
MNINEFVPDCPTDSQLYACENGRDVTKNKISEAEVTEIVKSHCEVWDKGVARLDDFNSSFLYQYSAYCVQSATAMPIEDCLMQLEKMQCFERSLFIVKIWTNSKTVIPDTELAKLVHQFQRLDLYSVLDPTDFTAIGYDDTLADGMVKMFIVRFWIDSGWGEFDDIYLDSISGNVENYIAKKQLLIKYLSTQRNTGKLSDSEYHSYCDMFFKNKVIEFCPNNENYHDLELLDYLVDIEVYSAKYSLLCLCEEIEFLGFDDNNVAKDAYLKFKWCLKRGSSLTGIIKGCSCLDFIRKAYAKEEKRNWKGKKTRLDILKKMERLLLKHGAKTAEEIRKMDINFFCQREERQ